MDSQYIYPKSKLNKFKPKFLQIFFYDGNYVSINKKEIVSTSINYYDKLIWEENCLCPVGKNGFVKLKIEDKILSYYNESFLYDSEEFEKDRKSYIINRCINEGRIKCVRLFNYLNWHITIYGNIVATCEDDYLILNYVPNELFGSADSKNTSINLNPLDKNEISNIELSFENFDRFTVYREEIIDINLTFCKQLEWGGGDFFRNIDGGYLRVKLDKTIDYREYRFLSNIKNLPAIKYFENRLSVKKGEKPHDICHLYIEYDYAGCGSSRTECFEIEDIRSDEEIKRLEKLEEETGNELIFFDGGYCKKLPDGSILIAFGKNAKSTIEKLSCNK
jgi:hypothetical protein